MSMIRASAPSSIASTGEKGLSRETEEHLGFVDVADAGHRALIEQRVADRFGSSRAQSLKRLVAIEVRIEEIRTQSPAVVSRHGMPPQSRDSSMNSATGTVESDRLVICRRDYETHVTSGALPRLSRFVDVPASIHAHVCVQHQTAGELHQDMLSDRSDVLDRPACQWVILVDAIQRWQDGFEPHHGFPRERAMQRPRGSKYGVAFRHGCFSLLDRGLVVGLLRRPADLEAHRRWAEAGVDQV